MRKSIPIAAAVVAVLLLAGSAAFMWKVEKRNIEDLSVALLNAHRRDAALASSLLPLLDRLKTMNIELAAMEPGSQDRSETGIRAAEVRNLLFSQMPALASGRDSEGNAVLIPLDEARSLLELMASWREE